MARKVSTMELQFWSRNCNISRPEIARQYNIPVSTQTSWKNMNGIDPIYSNFLITEFKKLNQLHNSGGYVSFCTIVRECITEHSFIGCTVSGQTNDTITEIDKIISRENSLLASRAMKASVEKIDDRKYRVVESEFYADYISPLPNLGVQMYPIYQFKSECLKTNNEFDEWLFSHVNDLLKKNEDNYLELTLNYPIFDRVNKRMADNEDCFLNGIHASCEYTIVPNDGTVHLWLKRLQKSSLQIFSGELLFFTDLILLLIFLIHHRFHQ